MKIGTGTYAYYWQILATNVRPPSVIEMMRETAGLGAQVFQICDYPPLERFSSEELGDIRQHARDLGLDLEIGTRGTEPSHLRRFHQLAETLGASLVRTILSREGEIPDLLRAQHNLESVIAIYEQSGITLGLETYEQVSAEHTMQLVNAIGSDRLGIVLDPGNSVAAFEFPLSLIERSAPYVVNIHVKDFAFARREGGQGFTLTGRPLGEGAVDLDLMVSAVATHRPDVNLILEHWVPWQDSEETTLEIERSWTVHGMQKLREWAHARHLASLHR